MNTLLIIILFLFALLSRESAVCYIPLLFLLNLKIKSKKWNEVLLIAAIPFILYVLFRFYAEIYFANSNLGSTIDSIEINPLKLLYKIVHYFLNIILPVKLIFEFIGFDKLDLLIQAFISPSENLTAFLLLSISAFTIFIFIIFYLVKILKKAIVFPLLFIFSSLAIYFLSFNTAERFLYLPSVGLSILLAMFLNMIKHKKLAIVLLVMFLIIHSVSLIQRSYRYRQTAEFSYNLMKDLYKKTDDINIGSSLILENIPRKKFGLLYYSIENFQDNWDYNYPLKKLNFKFSKTIKTDYNVDAVYKFNNEKAEFERVK